MYFEKNSNHNTNYGLAVGNALNDAFSEYRHVLKACFKVLNDSKKIVVLPWLDFERIFLEYESTTGARYYPDLTFYNFIASYVSNGNNIDERENVATSSHPLLAYSVDTFCRSAHTFATTVTRSNAIPIETMSAILGR